MKAKTHHKAHARHRSNGHHSDGVTFGALIESAKQAGRDARDATMDQVVQPTMKAMRQAGHQIEHGMHETMDYMGGRLKQVESQTAEHPIRALACAVGTGMLLGFWLARK